MMYKEVSPRSGLLSNFLSLSSHGVLILKFLCYFGIWFITVSQRRTQPYGDGETLTSRINDLIIDTIYEIRQPIIDIAHSKTSEDPVDCQGDSTFFNFPETQAGSSGPPEPP